MVSDPHPLQATFLFLSHAFRPNFNRIRLSQLPGVEVLQISNQDQVQVRVQLSHAQQLAALRSKHGVTVMFEYVFPVDGTGQPPPTTAALCVEVPFLLGALRFCRQEGVQVMQVYDFWN